MEPVTDEEHQGMTRHGDGDGEGPPEAVDAPRAGDVADTGPDAGEAPDAPEPPDRDSWAGLPGPGSPRSDRPALHLVPAPHDHGRHAHDRSSGDGRGSGQAHSHAQGGVTGVEEFELQAPPDMDVQHCYRHPDRETGVSCSNCGRPICWECMTPAAVGFRCPECMGQTRAERKSAPVYTRGQIRDRWQGIGLSGRTPATIALIGINVLLFILQSVSDLVTAQTALVPYYVAVEGEYWRLATSIFVHASLIHLAFNMFALYIAGTYVESMIGTLRFLVVFVLSGLGGSVLVLVAADPLVATVGASGAVFGLFGALFALFLHQRDAMAAAALRNIGFLIAINLVFTFVARGISWQAHIGGLLTGFLVMELLQWFGRRSPRGALSATQIAGLVGLAVLLVALIVWRIAAFPTF